jgi:thiol:disulfide interchange protein
MSSNYVVVASKEAFQAALEQDLNRVSVLNFRADWAEPCKTMSVTAMPATRQR